MAEKFDIIFKDVTTLLMNELPDYLTYHNLNHTLYVIEKAEHIASKENVSQKEILLVKIAALYHDLGFVKIREGHEKESCKIAKRQLSAYGYSKEDIDIICEAIMATKVPQNPTNHLGQILADADLEYLATKRFKPVSELLYQELKYFNSDLTRDQWNQMQIEFLSKHNYHTKYCKRYKSFRKEKNLQSLKANI
ncbi:HD domain-containing protein [Psychroserpens mesophilus]|uniref:HD domain-containing protein n=1 Tax=Psychroserpens mesophilus TaxID=325473 RepID=UPI003D64A0D5